MNILITRAKDESFKMAAELKQLGHMPVVDPIIKINYINNWFDDYKKIKNNVDLIIFTSKYAVYEFAKKEKERSANIFVVGQKCFAEAKKFGFINVQVADGDACSLLEKIINKKDIQEILYLSGENISLEIDKVLFKHGINCTRLKLYKTSYVKKLKKQTISLLLQQKIELIIICSVLTAATFKKNILKIKTKIDFSTVKLLVLSAKIADELKTFNFNKIFIYNNNQLLTVYDILKLVNGGFASK